MNSMLVGPSVTLGANVYGTITALVKSVEALPEDTTGLTASDYFYLTVADSTHAIGLWHYVGSAWVSVDGSEIKI
jgi:hypothetical protein